MNVVSLIGRITKDIEKRYTNDGKVVATFTLAVNRNYTSADGQQADFIPCQVWGKIAENVERYCSKGSLVGVDGKLRSRSYDNKQGQKVFVVEVICNSVQFLETKASRERAQQDSNEYYERNNDSYDSFNISPDDIQF